MRVTIIVAAARNNVIGRDGALPWKLSDDLKRFKSLTWGKPIVMGRKTFESIGRPLPGRTSIVVSRAGFSAPGTRAAASLDEALGMAEGPEAMIIGGAAIFEAALARADRIHFTRVDADLPGDVLFPNINASDWRRTAAGSTAVCPRNDYACRFFILDRL
ncbi:MAG: dihydrofolate reductase [Parvularculaceae bacterium]